MAPDAFDSVGMDEAHLTVHKLSGVTDRHMTIEIVVPSPLIGEDQSFRSCRSENAGTEGYFLPIRNALEQALFCISREPSEYPLCTEHRFIPFRDTGDAPWLERHHEMAEDSVQTLTGLAVASEEVGNVFP